MTEESPLQYPLLKRVSTYFIRKQIQPLQNKKWFFFSTDVMPFRAERPCATAFRVLTKLQKSRLVHTLLAGLDSGV